MRIRDIGRVELGAQTYSGFSRLNGKPSANVIVYLAPGANAVETADQVIKYMESVKASFPTGIDYVVPYNSTMFVRAAIKDVAADACWKPSGWSFWWSSSSCRTGAPR